MPLRSYEKKSGEVDGVRVPIFPFKGTFPVAQLPSIRPCLLKVPPLPSSTSGWVFSIWVLLGKLPKTQTTALVLKRGRNQVDKTGPAICIRHPCIKSLPSLGGFKPNWSSEDYSLDRRVLSYKWCHGNSCLSHVHQRTAKAAGCSLQLCSGARSLSPSTVCREKGRPAWVASDPGRKERGDDWEGEIGAAQGYSLLMPFKPGMNQETIVEGIE